jgi:hypothetical protein
MLFGTSFSACLLFPRIRQDLHVFSTGVSSLIQKVSQDSGSELEWPLFVVIPRKKLTQTITITEEDSIRPPDRHEQFASGLLLRSVSNQTFSHPADDHKPANVLTEHRIWQSIYFGRVRLFLFGMKRGKLEIHQELAV